MNAKKNNICKTSEKKIKFNNHNIIFPKINYLKKNLSNHISVI